MPLEPSSHVFSVDQPFPPQTFAPSRALRWASRTAKIWQSQKLAALSQKERCFWDPQTARVGIQFFFFWNCLSVESGNYWLWASPQFFSTQKSADFFILRYLTLNRSIGYCQAIGVGGEVSRRLGNSAFQRQFSKKPLRPVQQIRTRTETFVLRTPIVLWNINDEPTFWQNELWYISCKRSEPNSIGVTYELEAPTWLFGSNRPGSAFR